MSYFFETLFELVSGQLNVKAVSTFANAKQTKITFIDSKKDRIGSIPCPQADQCDVSYNTLNLKDGRYEVVAETTLELYQACQ